jgi:hypothetical protein
MSFFTFIMSFHVDLLEEDDVDGSFLHDFPISLFSLMHTVVSQQQQQVVADAVIDVCCREETTSTPLFLSLLTLCAHIGASESDLAHITSMRTVIDGAETTARLVHVPLLQASTEIASLQQSMAEGTCDGNFAAIASRAAIRSVVINAMDVAKVDPRDVASILCGQLQRYWSFVVTEPFFESVHALVVNAHV